MKRALGVAFSVLFLLMGCGGGNDSAGSLYGGTQPEPIQLLPPINSVPAPVYADAQRAELFGRVNYFRNLLGLGLLRQNASLDVAAQSHAAYVRENGIGHSETPGSVGFTGVDPRDRAARAGYKYYFVGENVGGSNRGAASAADIYMGTLYHRIPFIRYSYIDLGVGISVSKGDSGITISVLEFGIPEDSIGQGADVPYVVWPLRNSILERGTIEPGEIPSPPGAGYPITISFDPRKTIVTTRFELRESGSTVVPSNLLTSTTDPNRLLPPSIVALMPREGLKASTGFTASWEGTVDGVPLTVNWGFTTK